MTFDWTINLGNVLVAVGLLVGFLAAHIQNVRKLENIDTKVGMMFDWFKSRIIGRRETHDD